MSQVNSRGLPHTQAQSRLTKTLCTWTLILQAKLLSRALSENICFISGKRNWNACHWQPALLHRGTVAVTTATFTWGRLVVCPSTERSPQKRDPTTCAEPIQFIMSFFKIFYFFFIFKSVQTTFQESGLFFLLFYSFLSWLGLKNLNIH